MKWMRSSWSDWAWESEGRGGGEAMLKRLLVNYPFSFRLSNRDSTTLERSSEALRPSRPPLHRRQ